MDSNDYDSGGNDKTLQIVIASITKLNEKIEELSENASELRTVTKVLQENLSHFYSGQKEVTKRIQALEDGALAHIIAQKETSDEELKEMKKDKSEWKRMIFSLVVGAALALLASKYPF